MFDGYHFGSLKFYDEMMITLGIGEKKGGGGLSNELKNWAVKGPIWTLLVAARVFGMR